MVFAVLGVGKGYALLRQIEITPIQPQKLAGLPSGIQCLEKSRLISNVC
jgi:hypothetical protein